MPVCSLLQRKLDTCKGRRSSFSFGFFCWLFSVVTSRDSVIPHCLLLLQLLPLWTHSSSTFPNVCVPPTYEDFLNFCLWQSKIDWNQGNIRPGMTKWINRTLMSSGHLRRGLDPAPLSLTTASQCPLHLVLPWSSARLKHLEQIKQSLWRGKKVSTNWGRASRIWERRVLWLEALDLTKSTLKHKCTPSCFGLHSYLYLLAWFELACHEVISCGSCCLSPATSFSALASFLCLRRGTWGCRDRWLSEYDQITYKHENLMPGTQTNIRCWA